MDYAMRALARRAHTSFELRQKLKRRKLPSCEEEEARELEEKIITRLTELGLLNDAAYLEHTLQDAAHFKFQGPNKVAARLYKKGIPIDQTKEAWKSLKLSELEIAQKALQKAEKRFTRLFRSLPPEKRALKKAQFLASRGFSPHIIFRIISANQRISYEI